MDPNPRRIHMIEVVPGGPMFEGEGDLLVVPVFADLTWGPGAEAAAERLGPWLDDYLTAREFTGGAGDLVSVPGSDLPYREVAFVGLGDEVDAEGLRRASGTVGRFAGPYQTVCTTLNLVDITGSAEAVAVGYLLGAYQYDEYRSEPKVRSNERLELLDATDGTAAAIDSATAVARGVSLARDLINQPAVDKARSARREGSDTQRTHLGRDCR